MPREHAGVARAADSTELETIFSFVALHRAIRLLAAYQSAGRETAVANFVGDPDKG